jgi:hypothetical protein
MLFIVAFRSISIIDLFDLLWDSCSYFFGATKAEINIIPGIGLPSTAHADISGLAFAATPASIATEPMPLAFLISLGLDVLSEPLQVNQPVTKNKDTVFIDSIPLQFGLTFVFLFGASYTSLGIGRVVVVVGDGQRRMAIDTCCWVRDLKRLDVVGVDLGVSAHHIQKRLDESLVRFAQTDVQLQVLGRFVIWLV